MYTLIITADYHDVRVDKVARVVMKDFPLAKVFSSFRKGQIKVNGKKVEQNFRLKKGDVVDFFEVEGSDFGKVKVAKVVSDQVIAAHKKQIVFENNSFLLFHKQPNQVTHTGSEHEVGIVEVLKQYYNNADITAINRLDKPTSGLVLIGKNKAMIRKLSDYLQQGLIEKKYLVLSKGEALRKEFSVNEKLITTEENVKIDAKGKPSLTEFKVLDQFGGKVLLEATLKTGRKHQIRVHLASVKLPIIGDMKYGKTSGKTMYLCAYKLSILPLKFTFELKEEINEFEKKLYI